MVGLLVSQQVGFGSMLIISTEIAQEALQIQFNTMGDIDKISSTLAT